MAQWTAEILADALRIALASVSMSEDGYQPSEVLVQGSNVALSFRLRDDSAAYVVRFATEGPLRGESTGELCSSPEEWATEVRMLLDEHVGTREIHSARRIVEDDGVVVLDL